MRMETLQRSKCLLKLGFGNEIASSGEHDDEVLTILVQAAEIF
jgi:hypothetical protein